MPSFRPSVVVVLVNDHLELDGERQRLFEEAADVVNQRDDGGLCISVTFDCTIYSFQQMSKFLSICYTRLAQYLTPMARSDIVFEDLRRLDNPERPSLLDEIQTSGTRNGTKDIRVIREAPSRTSSPAQRSEDSILGKYDCIALGGTFDHLHPGHKVLLTMSAWIVRRRIIVGITDEVLLGRKKHKELLESLATRTEAVRDFLRLIAPDSLHLDLPPLQDVYGPTATEANCHAMVVSRESMAGADAVAQKRKDQGLPPLDLYVIDIVAPDVDAENDGPSDEDLIKQKMSSTAIREYLATSATPTAIPTSSQFADA